MEGEERYQSEVERDSATHWTSKKLLVPILTFSINNENAGDL